MMLSANPHGSGMARKEQWVTCFDEFVSPCFVVALISFRCVAERRGAGRSPVKRVFCTSSGANGANRVHETTTTTLVPPSPVIRNFSPMFGPVGSVVHIRVMFLCNDHRNHQRHAGRDLRDHAEETRRDGPGGGVDGPDPGDHARRNHRQLGFLHRDLILIVT